MNGSVRCSIGLRIVIVFAVFLSLGACGRGDEQKGEPVVVEATSARADEFIQAVLLGDEPTVRQFLADGVSADVKAGGVPAIVAAARARSLSMVVLLLDSGAFVDAADVSGRTSLMTAAEQGDLAIVDCLVERKAVLDAADSRGWTALMDAVMKNHEECAERILAAGARKDPTNAQGQSAADLARLNGRIEFSERLTVRP